MLRRLLSASSVGSVLPFSLWTVWHVRLPATHSTRVLPTMVNVLVLIGLLVMVRLLVKLTVTVMSAGMLCSAMARSSALVLHVILGVVVELLMAVWMVRTVLGVTLWNAIA